MFITVYNSIKEPPEATNTTWEHEVVQQRTVHLIRDKFRSTSRQHQGASANSLKSVYMAPSEDTQEFVRRRVG